MKSLAAKTFLTTLLLCTSAFAADTAPTDTVSPDLPLYEPIPNLTGTVNCVGSSTVANLLQRWGLEFKTIAPKTLVSVKGSDSAAAPAALTAGTTDLAPMSRPMNKTEEDAFTKKFGYPPLKLAVAADALAIYVEKDNPVISLSLAQIDAIFSHTLKRGGPPVHTWKDLGVSGDLANQPIARYAIFGSSGTVSVFKDTVLNGGDLAFDVTRFRGSSSVVQAVAADNAGICFASVVLATKRTRQVPILDDTGTAYLPSYENVLSEKYPLTRLLYIYANKPPHKSLPQPTDEFLKYILSADGQRVVAAGGNLPLTTAVVTKQRALLAP